MIVDTLVLEKKINHLVRKGSEMSSAVLVSASSTTTATTTMKTTTARTTVETNINEAHHEHNDVNTADASPPGTERTDTGSLESSPGSTNNLATTYNDESRLYSAAGMIDDDDDDKNNVGFNRHYNNQPHVGQESKQKSNPSNTDIAPGNESRHTDKIIWKPLSSHSTYASTTTAALSSATKCFGEGPLPRELRRIIQEVAKTGGCSWLSWKQDTTIIGNRNNIMTPMEYLTTDKNLSPSNSLTTAGSASRTKTAAVTEGSSFTLKHVNGNDTSNKRRSFSDGGTTSRQSTLSLPPRRKHRNGVIHKGNDRMRFSKNIDGMFGWGNSSVGNSRKRPRKRPRGLVRAITNPSSNSNAGGNNSNQNSSCGSGNDNSTPHNPVNMTAFSSSTASGGVHSSAPSSVGSGRSTGSNSDYDSTQYECDSEGTSATTNSEISLRKTTRAKRSGAANTSQDAQRNIGPDDIFTATMDEDGDDDEINSINGDFTVQGSPYTNLQTAFRVALGLVLDNFYHNKNNGYKLSPAENRRNERLAETVNNTSAGNNNSMHKDSSMLATSTTKRDKLSTLLSSEHVFQQRRQRLMAMLLPSATHINDQHRQTRVERQIDDPPFTIQRIAEVLVAPHRYYTQTHKLCNCLEKLLLVSSSTNAFGGITGGDTLQRRGEERELAALADEKGRQKSEVRQRRFRQRTSSPIDEVLTTVRDSENKTGSFAEKNDHDNEGIIIDQSLTSPKNKRSVCSSSESSSRETLEALARASLRTKFDNVGLDPLASNINERDIQTIAENRGMTNSPPPPNLNMAASIQAGGLNSYTRHHSPERQTSDQGSTLICGSGSTICFSSVRNATDVNLETATNLHMLQLHALSAASLNSSSSSPLELMATDPSTISQVRYQSNAAGAGSESTDGRSSASNSDVDSESDDISFDDSASDRSDGSDSGSTTYNESFTAARAMALNRMQQQQRLQSRVLTSGGSLHQNEGYQSGDSIDSTKAEGDSGGSDSSLSDFAD